jgi:hypothetical protein
MRTTSSCRTPRRYRVADSHQQSVQSVTVTVSNPGIFSSLTLTASVGSVQLGSSIVNSPDIATTTTFPFVPPLIVESGGGSITFSLTGVAGTKSTLIEIREPVRLAGVFASPAGTSNRTGSLLLSLGLVGFVILPLPFASGVSRR